MDKVISFTPSELMGFITTICACCAGIATLVGIIVKLVMRMKKPEIEQNKRIKQLEDDVKQIKEQNKLFAEYFTNDDKRFKEIEKSNKAILATLRALLKHAINGNDKEQLKKAEADLDVFLIEK